MVLGGQGGDLVNNSDEYGSYSREQHVENLKRLAQLRTQAQELGTGTGGIDEMMCIAVKSAFTSGVGSEEISQHSQTLVAQFEDEPDYWLISPLSENSERLVGGDAYVVDKNNNVFETSGSMPPRARIEAAKANT